MPNVASPHLLCGRVAAGCPQALPWEPAHCLWDGPWAADGSRVVAWGGEELACVPAAQNPPVLWGTPHRTLYPQFFRLCVHPTLLPPRPSVMGDAGGPPPTTNGARGCPHWDRPGSFVGFSVEPARGGCFGLISKRNVYVGGEREGGEEKRHSSAFGKREIVLEAVAAIADKSRSRQIAPTLIRSREALSSQRLAPHCAVKPPSIPGEPETSLSGAPASTDGQGCTPQRGRNICGVSQRPKPSFPAPSPTHLS